MRRTAEQRLFIAVFLAPALLLFTAFVAVPSLRALAYSLEKWDGLSAPRFAGLDNFRALWRDSVRPDYLFLRAVAHNLILMVFGGAGITVLALGFAALIHRRIRGASLFRVTFFFPNVLSSVAIALLWVLLYSPTSFGIINNALLWVQDSLQCFATAVHLSLSTLEALAGPDSPWHRTLAYAQARVPWPDFNLPFPFTESKYLIYSVIPMMIWTATGFYMILFLAAMESIPETFYEAAKLDGASDFAQFRHITLPLIREVLAVGLVFLVIGCLKLFDVIWVMENQVPQPESHVMGTLLYQKVFTEYDVGYGSAVAVILFVLVFLATLLTLRLSRREALEY